MKQEVLAYLQPITREEKDEAVEKLVQMVEKMNAAMGYQALQLNQKKLPRRSLPRRAQSAA